MSDVISSFFLSDDGSELYNLGKKEYRGQVEKIHYIDDESNLSKKWIEYDVTLTQELGGRFQVNNVPYCESLSGVNDNSCTILEHNEVSFDGERLSERTNFNKKNGTIVIVSFRDGNLQKPYISGFMPNERLTGATRSKGVHKSSTFRGFEEGITKDGVKTLKYTGPNNPDGTKVGSVTNTEVVMSEKITLRSGDVTVVIDNGAVTITSGSSVVTIKDGKIDLKGDLVDIGAADLAAVLFEHLEQEFNTHQHPAGTLGAPTGVPMAPMLSTVASKTVKLKV